MKIEKSKKSRIVWILLIIATSIVIALITTKRTTSLGAPVEKGVNNQYIVFIFLSLFAFICLYLSDKTVKKGVESLRKEITSNRKILCEGVANYQVSFWFRSGYLFLSDGALEFYEATKRNAKNFYILTDEIQEVSIQTLPFRKLLTINTKSETYRFAVADPKIWKEYLTKAS